MKETGGNMSFTIRNVLELEMMKNARLLAGEAKLDNPVLWVNVMDILDSFEIIEKGELMITTGFGLNDYELHRDTVRLLAGKNLSGLAVQPGHYIDSIPDFIISEAEKYEFPLIELPKKLTFSSITKAVLKSIEIYEKQPLGTAQDESNFLNGVLRKGFLSVGEEQQILSTLKHASGQSFYCIMLSLFEKDLGILDHEDAYASLNSAISELAAGAGAACMDGVINGYYGILMSVPEDILPNDIEDLLNAFTMKKADLEENVLMYAGVSHPFPEANGLYQGFQEAGSALERLQYSNVKKGALYYGNIDLFKYICGQNAKNASQFIGHTLSPVYQYDRVHKTELLRTLRTFFRCDLNYQDTSNFLFIHRHTTKYRLEKIEELLQVDLASHDAQFKLSMALYLDKYYK